MPINAKELLEIMRTLLVYIEAIVDSQEHIEGGRLKKVFNEKIVEAYMALNNTLNEVENEI